VTSSHIVKDHVITTAVHYCWKTLHIHT